MGDETEVFRCRFCGGEEFYAWYTVDERQGIDILGSHEGELRLEWDGFTKSGDANSDDEFWCARCEANSTSLEYLVGLTEHDPSQDTEKRLEPCVSFSPQAIREHFEGRKPDPTAGMTDDELRAMGEYAISSDALWELFHELLVEALPVAKDESRD